MPLLNLKETISQETTATKLRILRSQSKLLDAMVAQIQNVKQRSAGSPIISIHGRHLEDLLFKAQCLKDVSITHCDDVKQVAKDAILYAAWLRGTCQSKWPEDLQETEKWSERVDEAIKILRRRTNHAIVFCDLIQEWVEESKTRIEAETASDEDRPKDTSKPLPPLPSVTFKVKSYLLEQNISPTLMGELEDIARRTATFEQDLKDQGINAHEVKRAMLTLSHDARTFTPELRRQLADEANKQMVLDELCGCYASAWKSIEAGEWTWTAAGEGIRSTKQRHLNGKQRDVLDLNIVQAIFVQLVGQKWTDHFSEQMDVLRRHDTWKVKMELEGVLTTDQVETIKRQLQLIGLVVNEKSGSNPIEQSFTTGLKENRAAEIRQNIGRLLSGQTYDYDGSPEGPNDSYDPWSTGLAACKPAKAYADVYRAITTDIEIVQNVAPDREMTVLHGDLQDFGLSVSHEILLEVLEFFGVSATWLQWFETYLTVPIITADGTVETATRGTPFGLSPSLLLDELLLIILDLAMVSRSQIVAHRNHDDFWLWSTNGQEIENAWAVMQNFANLTGLAWNNEKTSCTTVAARSPSSTASSVPTSYELPQQNLRWGLVELEKTGTWSINEGIVDAQAKAALQDSTDGQGTAVALFTIVNVLNKYQSFIVRNCGVPTSITGPAFSDTVNQAIHLFSSKFEGGMLSWVSKQSNITIGDKGGSAYGHAVFSWPLELGGFGLLFPTISSLALREDLGLDKPDRKKPFEFIIREFEKEYERYRLVWEGKEATEKFYEHRNQHDRLAGWLNKQESFPKFITKDQYVRYCILEHQTFRQDYSLAVSHVELQPEKIKNLTDRLFGPVLKDYFGQGRDELVSKEMVPRYTMLELREKSRELFRAE